MANYKGYLKDKDGNRIYDSEGFFPIGAIYLSVTNTNPSKWFGGTWEQIAQGRTLVGVDTTQAEFNTVKKTGGEKAVQLTSGNYAWGNYLADVPVPEVGGAKIDTFWQPSGNLYGLHSRYGDTNVNAAHNNLQPYFTCYIWCRTA